MLSFIFPLFKNLFVERIRTPLLIQEFFRFYCNLQWHHYWFLIMYFLLECPTEIKEINGNYYYLSNDPVDSNSARDVCSSYNGQLAVFTDSQTEQQLKNFVNETYIQGKYYCL